MTRIRTCCPSAVRVPSRCSEEWLGAGKAIPYGPISHVRRQPCRNATRRGAGELWSRPEPWPAGGTGQSPEKRSAPGVRMNEPEQDREYRKRRSRKNRSSTPSDCPKQGRRSSPRCLSATATLGSSCGALAQEGRATVSAPWPDSLSPPAGRDGRPAGETDLTVGSRPPSRGRSCTRNNQPLEGHGASRIERASTCGPDGWTLRSRG